MYQIRFFRDIKKQLARFPSKDQERIWSAIRALAAEPRPPGSVHLRDILYRLRVGNYRVIYAIFDKELVVAIIETARRSEATYENMEKLIQKALRTVDSE